MTTTPGPVAPALADDATLPKRTWHYLASPASFEMAPCSCGNHATQWSEFAKHLWCAACEKDFIPEHNGIFDGPIPVKLALMMGMSFDRMNMEAGCVERYNPETSLYTAEPARSTPASSAL
jgi:hypothetical protein